MIMNAASNRDAQTEAPALLDRYGRKMEYIRVSLTEQCNFSCPFCMPADAVACQNPTPHLSSDETVRLCQIFSRLGVSSFKITGGEPLLSADALPILGTLKKLPGVDCVTITTNGSTLERHAQSLAEIGVDGVNISLNAFSADTYRKVTGSAYRVSAILENIRMAKRLGLHVKLNMVPIHGLNDDDIIPVLEFALANGIYLRFIELMPIGQGKQYQVISRAEIMGKIEARFGKPEVCAGRFGNGPATYYSIKNHPTKIGYIAAVSEQFCSTCNRIRLSATGFLKTCLHHNHGIDLGTPLWNGADDDTLQEMICLAVSGKPAGHEFFHESLDDIGTTPMYRVGG